MIEIFGVNPADDDNGGLAVTAVTDVPDGLIHDVTPAPFVPRTKPGAPVSGGNVNV